MNINKLKQAEEAFLNRYPGGFEHPEINVIAKKHKIEQMISLTREAFDKKNFNNPHFIVQSIGKIVTRSSLVSVFEKVKFRDIIQTMGEEDIDELAGGLWNMLYSDQKKGFDKMVNILQKCSMAKWPILTVIPNYFYPDKEVFIKPTTAKGVIDFFEIEGIKYSPKPSWEFYEMYRAEINRMRTLTDPGLTQSNAGFCGFLMMSIK